jgi:hypothetical protein
MSRLPRRINVCRVVSAGLVASAAAIGLHALPWTVSFGDQRAAAIARWDLQGTLSPGAHLRAHVEVRPASQARVVILRDVWDECPKGIGMCRYGRGVYRDVYACIDNNEGTLREWGASPAPNPLPDEDFCAASAR